MNKQQDLVSHQQLELSKEQRETRVQKEDAIVKWFVCLCVKATCREKQGCCKYSDFGRQ